MEPGQSGGAGGTHGEPPSAPLHSPVSLQLPQGHPASLDRRPHSAPRFSGLGQLPRHPEPRKSRSKRTSKQGIGGRPVNVAPGFKRRLENTSEIYLGPFLDKVCLNRRSDSSFPAPWGSPPSLRAHASVWRP